MAWRDKLLPSQVDYVQSIVDQIPDIGREAFVGVLNVLAGAAAPVAFHYYIVDCSGGEVVGSNDDVLAASLADSEDYFVIDMANNTWIQQNGEHVEIEEAKIKLDVEEEDDDLPF